MTRPSTKNFVNYAPVILSMLVIQGAELFPAYHSGTERAKPGSGTWQSRSIQTQYNYFEKSETKTHAKDNRPIAHNKRQGFDHWKNQAKPRLIRPDHLSGRKSDRFFLFLTPLTQIV